MPRQDVLVVLLFLVSLFFFGIPLGRLIAAVLEGKIPGIFRVLIPVERLIYKICAIYSEEDQRPKLYLRNLLLFNLIGVLFLSGLLLIDPKGISWDLAFNTAISFVTNTNWQAYSGEVSLSNISQVLGLTVQNFFSAATGLSLVAVISRGLSRKLDGRVGNFGVDVVRVIIYVLLPLSLILALSLISQGVVQNFSEYVPSVSIEGTKQLIPMGPAASQIAIKQLGTNGGGFFGMNSAHPFENPTPFSNFLQLLSILLIPFSQVVAFGHMLKKPKEGHAILGTMFLIFLPLLCLALYSEHQGIPSLGTTMEGKEVRFGVTESVLWATSTTAASNGSVNSMHSSLTPLTGLVLIFQMLTGEVIFGGAGSGLYGIALYMIITLFLSGLMVGRSPEWLGKKIEAYEVKLALGALLIPGAFILIGTSLGLMHDWGVDSLSHPGPHGLSELLYGFASTLGNNGSAFGGLNANTRVLNVLFGLCMVLGRFVVIIPVVLIAGSFSQKKSSNAGSGSFPTDGPLFVFLLAGIIIIFGALTFFPVLALGPIAEHLLMVGV